MPFSEQRAGAASAQQTQATWWLPRSLLKTGFEACCCWDQPPSSPALPGSVHLGSEREYVQAWVPEAPSLICWQLPLPGVRSICGPYPLYLVARAKQFVDNGAGLLSIPATNFTQGRNRCFKVFIPDAVFNTGYGQPNCSLAQSTQDFRREVLKLSHQRGCNLKRSHIEKEVREAMRWACLMLQTLDVLRHSFLPQTCVMKPTDGLPSPWESSD